MINRVALAGDDRLDLLLVQESEYLLTPICFIGMDPPNLRKGLLGKFEPEPAKSMSIVLPIFCSVSRYNCSGGRPQDEFSGKAWKSSKASVYPI